MDKELTPQRLGDIKRLLATYRNVAGAGYCTNLAGYTAELVAAYERLGALLADETRRADQLESELAVYRVTVLSVNVAAGQGED